MSHMQNWRLDPVVISEELQVHQWKLCDAHEWTIYYGLAIHLCSIIDTSDGEAWLEDCGGIAQPGDSFGNIACRIAFATLLCEAESKLRKLIYEREDAA